MPQLVKSNTNRFKFLNSALIGLLCLQMVSILFYLLQHQLLLDLSIGVIPNTEAIYENDFHILVINNCVFLFFIITFVLFLNWFRIAYRNLHAFVAPLKYKKEWAVLSWFVPFVNLYRPPVILFELLCATNKPTSRIKRSIPVIQVLLWWFICLITLTATSIFPYLFIQTETIDQILEGNFIQILLLLLQFISVYLTLRMVRKCNISELEMQILAQNELCNSETIL